MESRLIVHSWDFDGMLASEAYTQELKRLIIRAAEEGRSLSPDDYSELAKFIANKYAEFFDKKFLPELGSDHVVFIGSDRQDVVTDLNNGFKSRPDLYVTLSCYPFFSALIGALKDRYKDKREVNILLDTLLLEDTYHNLPAGTTFRMIRDSYFKLSPDFFSKLAKELQREPMDPQAANDLFSELKAAIRGDTQKKNEPSRLPNYTDKSKLLIMYAQIHRANAMYSNGRGFIYHYADDRHDILEAAQTNLPHLATQIPAGTQVRLEQFIPAELKRTLLHSSADNIYYADFTQSKTIAGCGQKTSDAAVSLLDISDAHATLNELFTDPVPNILLSTIHSRLRDKAFMYITLCVDILSARKNSQGLSEIKTLLSQYVKENGAQNNIALLNQIKEIGCKKLASKISRFGEAKFFKINPDIANFFNALKSLSPESPDTGGLEATYHLIQPQKKIDTPSLQRKSKSN